jgi:hypothetical protein
MHALSSAVTSTDKEVPGLLEVLAQVLTRGGSGAGGSVWCSC